MGAGSNTVGSPASFMNQMAGHEGPKFVAAATTLLPHERVVLATPPSSSSYTITLPPVDQCAGMVYTIRSTSNDTGTIVVADQDETPAPYTSGNLTTTDDYVVVYSDGYQWYELAETTT